MSAALVDQQAKCIAVLLLSSVNCLAVPYFSTLSHKWDDFLKKVIEHKRCVLISSKTFVQTFLILRRNKRDIAINVQTSPRKVPVILNRL